MTVDRAAQRHRRPDRGGANLRVVPPLEPGELARVGVGDDAPSPSAERAWFAEATHDLLGPLNVVEGAATTLREHRHRMDDETVDDLLERVERAAVRARALLRDVLDVQLGSLGALEVDLRPTDLQEFGRELVADLAPDVAARVHVTGGPVGAMLDRKHARRMVENLLGNAIKYAPADTTITIRTWADDGAAVLSVDDAGPGIPPREREVVFGAFQRLEAHASKVDGTGLGLHVVAVLARVQGAAVAIDDAPEGGASFQVAFKGA